VHGAAKGGFDENWRMEQWHGPAHAGIDHVFEISQAQRGANMGRSSPSVTHSVRPCVE
jgi:hypothetical protein